MDEKKIYQALDHIGQQHMPDTLDVLPAVQQQIFHRTQRYTSRKSQQLARVAASVMISLLFIATTAYAIVQWSSHDPALREDMITEIGQSQTIDGTTVNLDWGYADSNRIVLSYSITDESGQLQREQATDVSLTDAGGRVYQPVSAFYASFDVPEMLTGNAHFDASIIDDNPQSLDLQFSLLNRFFFDFTLPLIADVRIEKQPDVEVNGVRVNLEWAAITPSMTRAYLCYEVPQDEDWSASLKLMFDGQRVAREAGASYPDMNRFQRRDDGRQCRGYIFLAGYDERPQEITLTVSHLQTAHLYSEENMRRAAEVLASYGIEAIVTPNTAQEVESYLLSIPHLPDDLDLVERAWEDAMRQTGEPLQGERIDGPWIITAKLP